MSSDFRALVQSYEEFKILFDQPHPPLDKCKMLMEKLKVTNKTFE